MTIFLSYSREDAQPADRLRAALAEAGHEVWVDTHHVRGGDRWRAAIVNGIQAADVVVFLSSQHSVASREVAAEVQLARERHKRIVPVKLDDAEAGGELAYLLVGLHWIDYRRPGQEHDVAAAIGPPSNAETPVEVETTDGAAPVPRRLLAGIAALVIVLAVLALVLRDGGPVAEGQARCANDELVNLIVDDIRLDETGGFYVLDVRVVNESADAEQTLCNRGGGWAPAPHDRGESYEVRRVDGFSDGEVVVPGGRADGMVLVAADQQDHEAATAMSLTVYMWGCGDGYDELTADSIPLPD